MGELINYYYYYYYYYYYLFFFISPLDFFIYGHRGPLNGIKVVSRGVATFSTPSKAIPIYIFENMFPTFFYPPTQWLYNHSFL